MFRTSLRFQASTLVALLALLSLAGAERLAARQNEWTLQGPFGFALRADVIIPPDDPSFLYALVAGDLYRSDDAGTHWKLMRPSGLPPSSRFSSVRLYPHDSSTFFSSVGTIEGTAHYKSIDKGETWEKLNWPPEYGLLAFDPVTPGTFYFQVQYDTIRKTSDGGQTWRQLAPTPGVRGQRTSFVIDPANSSNLYLGTALDSCKYGCEEPVVGVFKSTDCGATWEASLTGPSLEIYDLAFDPHAPATLYALVASNQFELWVSTDAGHTWNLRSGNLPSMNAILPDPVVPGRIWGSHRFSYTNQSALAVSTDGGTTWQSLEPTEPVLGVAVDVSNPHRIFASTEDSGILRSIDDGQTWQTANGGLSNVEVTHLRVAPSDPRTIMITSSAGTFRSEDGARSWTLLNGDWRRVAIDAGDPKLVLLAFPNSHELPAIARSIDGGKTWHAAVSGIPETELGELAAIFAHPYQPGRVYVETKFRRSLFLSIDFGMHWERIGSRTFPIAADPRNPDVLYGRGSVVNGIYDAAFKSFDGGSSWVKIFDAFDVNAVAVAPSRPDIVYLGTRAGTYRSEDGGLSWTLVNPTRQSNYLWVHPTDPDVVYSGIARSLDAGKTFFSLFTKDIPSRLTRVFISPLEPDRIYVGTKENGVLAGTFPLPEPLSLGAGERFSARLSWRDPKGRIGTGTPVSMTEKSGYFWFFRPGNVELMTKLLDGRLNNGHFWFFYGALSNVEYQLSLKDRLTGASRTYVNEASTFASVGDVKAFPAPLDGQGVLAEELELSTEKPFGLVRNDVGIDLGTPATPCAAGGDSLCLLDGRFKVSVEWRTSKGDSGIGRPLQLTRDTGAFYFFRSDNVELLLKILDGRAANGHFWVFYGSLSNVEFTIRVTDNETGAVRAYHNAPGNFASAGDVEAF